MEEVTDVITSNKTSQLSILVFLLLTGSIILLFISYTPISRTFPSVGTSSAEQLYQIPPSTVAVYMGINTSKLLKPLRISYKISIKMHTNCRGGLYPRTKDIYRFDVPDDKVSWDVEYKEYQPVDYTAESVLQQPPWADPDIRKSSEPIKIKWNSLDNNIDRQTFGKKYDIYNHVPRNPHGRTGIIGRGLLGRWGPNHAADPIITRWKVVDGHKVKGQDGKPVLQFIAIQRRDTGDWAIPGGMVDAGELVTTTLQREFSEEALNALNLTPEKRDKLRKCLKVFFKNGKEVYKGYVDDIRNTDNSWIETVAMNFHDDNGTSVANLALTAGDDAVSVKWLDIAQSLKLYANHKEFMKKVANDLNGSW
ncbi:ADP-ribose pyrophosphatase, mitochondrial isoform X2 [Octopus sinensis]|uniref:ADP-ribose pyrophosphatase, mitochondrial isoform X2 n=1 Tax=Octopus sinensis TaxID=2607531 RepID=A0A6P7TPR8_9MOLL|nr:ADP-ribose pyrophosphatase, mitochondrial isoform X2 [Octopus sinensis]